MGSDAAAAPRIGGQHYRYLLSRLRDFAAVHRGALGESTLAAQDEEAVADYLSRLSPPRTAP
jgi:cytochrome c553